MSTAVAVGSAGTMMSLELRAIIRRLLARPRWTASAVAMVALIVGAATAQFAAIYGLMLKRYPFPNADRLVLLWEENRETGVRQLPLTESAYPIYRDRLTSFVTLANFIPPLEGFPVRLSDGTPVSYARASPELFSVLGVTPLHGRTFTAEEGIYPAEDVAILSHRYWVSHFGGSLHVIGTSIELLLAGQRTSHRVVGVMPEGVEFPYPLHSPRPDLWANNQAVPGRFLPGNNFYAIGLRKPSTTTAEIRVAAQTVARQIAAAEPRFYGSMRLDVVALHEAATKDIRGIVEVLAAAFLIVTVLGGANLTHLFIARGLELRQDATVRTALGARVVDLVKLTGLELGVLLAAGSAIGVPLAYQMLTLIPRFVPAGLHLPRAGALLSDPAVLAAALLGWVLIGIALTGGVWVAIRGHLVHASPMETSWITHARVTGRRRASRLLLGSEVALAFALTASALSMLQHVRELVRADAGLEPERLLAFDVFAPPETVGRAVPMIEGLLSSLEATPGIEHVAVADGFPLSPLFIHTQVLGLDAPAGRTWVPIEFHVVSENYAKVGGLVLLSGRTLQRSDAEQGFPVVIINDVMAKRYLPDVNPVGQRLRFDQGEIHRVWNIVGVVKEKRLGFHGEPKPVVFVPWAQSPRANVSVVMRSSGEARRIAQRVRERALAALPRAVEVQELRTGSEIVGEGVAASRFLANQLSGLAALSLLLAASGLYGVQAHTTAFRTRELAIRMALGSSPNGVVRLVTSDGLKTAAAGLLAGLPLALALEHLVRLVGGAAGGVSVLAYAATALMFLLLSVTATLPIALGASRVPPARLLN